MCMYIKHIIYSATVNRPAVNRYERMSTATSGRRKTNVVVATHMVENLSISRINRRKKKIKYKIPTCSRFFFSACRWEIRMLCVCVCTYTSSPAAAAAPRGKTGRRPRQHTCLAGIIRWSKVVTVFFFRQTPVVTLVPAAVCGSASRSHECP